MNCSAIQPIPPETMMSSMDFAKIGGNMTALIHGVMQANLRAIQELSRVESPKDVMELQRRFAREYVVALQHGTMMLMSALRADAIPSHRR